MDYCVSPRLRGAHGKKARGNSTQGEKSILLNINTTVAKRGRSDDHKKASESKATSAVTTQTEATNETPQAPNTCPGSNCVRCPPDARCCSDLLRVGRGDGAQPTRHNRASRVAPGHETGAAEARAGDANGGLSLSWRTACGPQCQPPARKTGPTQDTFPWQAKRARRSRPAPQRKQKTLTSWSLRNLCATWVSSSIGFLEQLQKLQSLR